MCLTNVMEQVLWEISKFPEIMGELSMRKQCVPGSFFSTHTREPGNEASDSAYTIICMWVLEALKNRYTGKVAYHQVPSG